MNTAEPRRGPGRPRKDGQPPQSKMAAGEPPRQLTRWEAEQAREQEELARREMAREAAARELARLDAMKGKLTASQHLARLQALRDVNGGFIVPKPAGIDGAKLTIGTTQGPPIPDDAAKRAMQWLRDIAAAGGSMGDMQLAWHSWRSVEGEANPKLPLMAAFETIAREAGQKYEQLVARADEEQRPARIVAELRRNLAIAEQRLESERKRYLGPAEAEVARCKALLAQAEKAAA